MQQEAPDGETYSAAGKAAKLPARSQIEFADLLQRYAAGQSTPAEQRHLARWLAESGTAETPPLPAAELEQIRQAMWQRICDATQTT